MDQSFHLSVRVEAERSDSLMAPRVGRPVGMLGEREAGHMAPSGLPDENVEGPRFRKPQEVPAAKRR